MVWAKLEEVVAWFDEAQAGESLSAEQMVGARLGNQAALLALAGRKLAEAVRMDEPLTDKVADALEAWDAIAESNGD